MGNPQVTQKLCHLAASLSEGEWLRGGKIARESVYLFLAAEMASWMPLQPGVQSHGDSTAPLFIAKSRGEFPLLSLDDCGGRERILLHNSLPSSSAGTVKTLLPMFI